MSVKTRSLQSLVFFLFAGLVLVSPLRGAAGNPSGNDGVPSPGTSLAAPVLSVKTIPAPAIPAPVAVPEPSSGALDAVQPPGLLHEIGQRQTELAILELDLKRAELQKKLRELESPPPTSSASAAPSFAKDTAGVPVPLKVQDGPPAQGNPAVRRIHKVGNELRALIVLGSGEVRDLRKGERVNAGMRVVEVRPDTVLVQQGDAPAFMLSGGKEAVLGSVGLP